MSEHAAPERRWHVTRPVPCARVYPTPGAALVRADEVVGVISRGRLYIVGDPVAVKRSMREGR